MKFDVFISHASEDKATIARPLAALLVQAGLRVWLDEYELKLGDSLRRNIDQGLVSSRFGVVILSPAFFRKEWPQKELDALAALEDGSHKVILPVWHGIEAGDIRAHSPLLADRLATRTNAGVKSVVADILRVVVPEVERSQTHVADDASSRSQTADAKHRLKGPSPLNDYLIRFLDQLESLNTEPAMVAGIRTGFFDLDLLLGGLKAGETYVLASRPSMGSTTFALNVSSHVANREGLPVVFFSPHNRGEDLMNRLIASEARVHRRRLASGMLTDDEWPRLVEAIETLRVANLFVDDSAKLSSEQVIERCEAQLRECGALGLVVIDSIDMLEDGANPPESLAAIRRLRGYAREKNFAILMTTSVPGVADTRADKRPLLSDLPTADLLQQQAQAVLLLYRDDYYDPGSQEPGVAEVIVAHNRGGPRAVVKLAFIGELSKLDNFALDPT